MPASGGLGEWWKPALKQALGMYVLEGNKLGWCEPCGTCSRLKVTTGPCTPEPPPAPSPFPHYELTRPKPPWLPQFSPEKIPPPSIYAHCICTFFSTPSPFSPLQPVSREPKSMFCDQEGAPFRPQSSLAHNPPLSIG